METVNIPELSCEAFTLTEWKEIAQNDSTGVYHKVFIQIYELLFLWGVHISYSGSSF